MKAQGIKVKFTIALMLLLSPVILMAQLNLDSCQRKALNNYPLIKQYGLIEKSKDLSLSNANKNYLPQLDITIIGGVIDGLPSFAPPGTETSSSAVTNLITIGQFNQLIWDGGMTKASKEIIMANSEIEKTDVDVNLYQLQDRINNLYFGVLLIDEQLKQLKLLKKTLIRNQNRIEIAIENGTAFKSDSDELKVELINVEQKQAELQYTKLSYIKVLSVIIGEEIDDNETFTRPVSETVIAGLAINRPEINKFKNQRSLIKANAQLNKAMLYPKLGLMAFGVFLNPGIEFGTSDITNMFVAGVSLSWKLSPIYKNGNNKKLTNINLQRIQNQEETFLFNTNLDLSKTEKELEKFSILINQDKEILILKSSIKEAYSVKYDNGVATMSQLLDKINDENLAKQMMITHEIQYLMIAYQYLNKSGN